MVHFGLLIAIPMIIWLLWPHLMTSSKWFAAVPVSDNPHTYEEWAKFGALFGALVPLTSILGFAAVLLSVAGQDSRFNKEYRQREEHERERLIIEMIMTLVNTHKQMDAKFCAKDFIAKCCEYIDKARVLGHKQNLVISTDLSDFIFGWEMSFSQLNLIAHYIHRDSSLSPKRQEFLKKYVTFSFSLNDSLIFSLLTCTFSGSNLYDIMKGFPFVNDKNHLIKRLASAYTSDKRYPCRNEEIAKVYVNLFLTALAKCVDNQTP